jgi:hypothetical protein
MEFDVPGARPPRLNGFILERDPQPLLAKVILHVRAASNFDFAYQYIVLLLHELLQKKIRSFAVFFGEFTHRNREHAFP